MKRTPEEKLLNPKPGSKIAAGRAKDLLVLPELEALRGASSDEEDVILRQNYYI